MSLKRTKLATTLATALAALPFALQAADTTMNEIVIKAAKEGASGAAAVSQADLQAARSATSDTAQMLRDVPGVSLQGAGGVSSLPIIHGLADDRLRIKVDGMDLIASCPNHMNPALSYIDPTQLGSLHVYAGIAPVSVGGDSIGGSIVAKSAEPVFAKPGQGSLFKGEAGAFYRSNGGASGGNLSATYATESFNVSYSGAIAQSDNYDAGGNFKRSIYGASTASPAVTGRIGHTLPQDEVGSTAYETRNHTLGFALKGGKHLVEAKFGYQNLPYQLYPNQRMDMLDNQQHRLNLRYLGGFDWGTLEARVYHEEVDHFMDFGADKRYWYGNAAPPLGSGGAAAPNGTPCTPTGTATCATGMPMYTASKNSGLTLRAEIDLAQQSTLRVGTEFQQYTLDDWWPASGGGMMPNTFWNINNGERDRSAVYGEWERRFSPQWQTLLGARYERVKMDTGPVQAYNNAVAPALTLVPAVNNSDSSRTDNNWDLTALARYTPSVNYDIEFGFARKTRSPNLYERYSWYSRGMEMLMINWFGEGNGYIGNRNLEPEKAHTLSATFDWHAADRSWAFVATPYYTHVDDYIDAIRCPAGLGGSCATQTPGGNKFVFLQFANHSARLYGIDLSGKLPLGKTGVGAFGLKGLLNYTNGKNRDTGDNLYNIMPLNAKLTLTHQYGGWDNAVELVMVKSKNDVSAVRNEVETPGYQLVNLRASYAWKQTRLDFGIENLFDKHYYLPLGGAYLGQGTTMTATANATGSVPAWGTAVPGMGRSLYAGINVKF
ncbi:TonB-dependent receptor [Rhodocyclaceae bacterium]